jgi:hypothetical protein
MTLALAQVASLPFIPVVALGAADTTRIGVPEGQPAAVKCPQGYLAGVALFYDNSMSGLQPYCVAMRQSGEWASAGQVYPDRMSEALSGKRMDLFCRKDFYVHGFSGHSHVYGVHSLMQLTLTCRNPQTGVQYTVATPKPAGVSLTEWPAARCADNSLANGVVGTTHTGYTIIQFGLSCAATPRTLVQQAATRADPRHVQVREPISAQTVQTAEPRVRRQLEAAQPNTPPTTVRAEATRGRLDPSGPATLNPQPLPPKATEIVRPENTTVLARRGQVRTEAGNRSGTPLQQSQLARRAGRAVDAEGRELFELRCRGGGQLAITEIGPAGFSSSLAAKTQRAQARLQQLSFLPAHRDAQGNSPPAGDDGRGLQVSTCTFADRAFTSAYPVGVVFDPTQAGSTSIREYLADPNHYWTFTAYDTKYGTFRAVRHGPWTPAGQLARAGSAISVPANLFSMDDRAIIIVGGKQQLAGEVKKDVRAALQKASGKPVQLTSVRKPPVGSIDTSIPASTTIQGTAARSPQVARAMESSAAASAARSNAVIAGTSNQPGARLASSLEIDCVSQQPNLAPPQGKLVPGTSVRLTGTCFGGRGTVEVQGDFAGRDTLRLSPTSWTTGAIDFLLPQLSGVRDQAVTVSVVRADGKRSLARTMPFLAQRHSVQVPAHMWTPAAHLERTITGEGAAFDLGGAPSAGEVNRPTFSLPASVAIAPHCALEGISATSRSGRIEAIEGWDQPGPAHLGSVSVRGKPMCTARVDQYEFVVAGYTEASVVCTLAVDLSATASCPAGLSP